MNQDNRNIIRKVKAEIFEMGYYTQSSETGLYECYPSGKPTVDPFRDCVNTVMVKDVLLGTADGFKYVRSAFSGTKAEFIIFKINKRNTQKLMVTREEYRKASRRKLK